MEQQGINFYESGRIYATKSRYAQCTAAKQELNVDIFLHIHLYTFLYASTCGNGSIVQ